MKFIILAAASLAALTACAQRPEQIAPFYVPDSVYSDYSCNQLKLESQRLARNLQSYSDVQHQIAVNDDIIGGVAGFILLIPSVFYLSGGNGEVADEIGQLRGEIDTLERVSIQKNCPVVFQTTG